MRRIEDWSFVDVAAFIFSINKQQMPLLVDDEIDEKQILNGSGDRILIEYTAWGAEDI